MVEKVLVILAKEDEIMTNYGAIQIMPNDELAKFLASIMDCKKCPALEEFCDGQRHCVDAILNWLNADECSDF